ncbi:MAG TPA: DNA/RNA helicase domain-containing protein, partial [Parasegetibacter sp.]
MTKKEARSSVKAFIQIVHHYRDEYLRDPNPPHDHVAIFDEAQRAWTREQTTKFMKEKKGKADFSYSEPEFLIHCLDRHQDWAVIICLVGGGQEINTGEAGISEWLASLQKSFPFWEARISSRLNDSEYSAAELINELNTKGQVVFNDNLHLSVSMRSYRAEELSGLIKQILDVDEYAKSTIQRLQGKYPIVLTRDIGTAKKWIKEKSRG